MVTGVGGAFINQMGNQKALEAMLAAYDAEQARQNAFLAQLDDRTLALLKQQSLKNRLANELAGQQIDSADIATTGTEVAEAAAAAGGAPGAGVRAKRQAVTRAQGMGRQVAKAKGNVAFNQAVGDHALDANRIKGHAARSRALLPGELAAASHAGQTERDIAQWLGIVSQGLNGIAPLAGMM